jgi:protein TonB
LAAEEQDRIARSNQAAQEKSALEAAPAPISPRIDKRRKMSLAHIALGMCFALLLVITGATLNDAALRQRLSGMWLNTLNSLKRNVPPTPSSLPVAVARSSFALHLSRQNGDLELTWNPQSAAIANASSAAVSIQDGNSNRVLKLDAAQLRGGNLLYSPISDQILMQLTVTTSTETASESVTAILPKVEAQAIPKPPAPLPPVPTQPAPAAQEVPPRKPSRAFVPPTPAIARAAQPGLSLQEAPAPGRTPAPEAALPGTTLSTPAPPQTAPQPVLEVVSYEPAVALVKTMPIFPPELRNLAVKQTVVQVNVTIDRNGRVSKAEAISQNNVSKFLLNAATNAARTWRFKPARRGGEPVPSESVVQFVFSR